MTNLTAKILTEIENRKASFQKRRLTLITAISDLNNSKSPTEDRNGRLHAPCNGYQFEDSKGNVEAYGAGEYLPVLTNLEDDFFLSGKKVKSWSFKSRIKLQDPQLSEVVSLSKETKFFLATAGKVWEQNGVNTAYVYLEVLNKSFFEFIELTLKEIEQKQKEVVKSLKGVSPTGKQAVTAIIKNIKENYFVRDLGFKSVAEYQPKISIEFENGATAYGTLPSNLIDTAKAGDLITFTATFDHPVGDNTHAFFKRPSKATLISKV